MVRHYEVVRLIYSGNPNMRKEELEREDKGMILDVLYLITGERIDPRKFSARELLAGLEDRMEELDY